MYSDYFVSGDNRIYILMWEVVNIYYILFLWNWPFCFTKISFFSSKLSVKIKNFAQIDLKKIIHWFPNNM